VATPVEIEKEIEQSLCESIHAYCERVSEELAQGEKALFRPEDKAVQLENEILESIKTYKKRLASGCKSCVDSLEAISILDRSVDFKACKKNLEAAMKMLSSKKNITKFAKQVVDGKSWCQLLGITQKSLELLYRAAQQIFTLKRFDEAVCAFTFLATIEPSEYAFWIGLGHSYFHLAEFSHAVEAYQMAALCDPFSVWPHFYSANCYETMNDFDQALVCLEDAQNTYVHQPDRDQELGEAINQRLASAKNRNVGE